MRIGARWGTPWDVVATARVIAPADLLAPDSEATTFPSRCSAVEFGPAIPGQCVASHRVRRSQRGANLQIQAHDQLIASCKGIGIGVTLAACAFRWGIPDKWFVLCSETMSVQLGRCWTRASKSSRWSSRLTYAVVMSHRFALDWEFRDLSPTSFIP